MADLFLFLVPTPQYTYVNTHLNHWSLDVSGQESPMEVATNCVIDETFLSLGLSTSLILKHHIIIPASLHLQTGA